MEIQQSKNTTVSAMENGTIKTFTPPPTTTGKPKSFC